MNITFFGHAALGIETRSGERLIIDPYRSGGFGGKIAYSPIKGDWDWVFVTHEHADHAAVDTLKGTLKNDRESMKAAFHLQVFTLPHDEYEGRHFGGMVNAVVLDIDGFRICHLSDVGCSPPREWFEEMGEIDLCFLPVGGYFTLGPLQGLEWYRTLSPKILVPIHYKTDAIDLPLEPLEHFLSYFSPDMIHRRSDLCLEKRSDLDKARGIVVLDAQNKK